MDRSYYLGLAAGGARAVIGTHLALHGRADAAEVPFDGKRLGAVVAEAAERFGTPLAFPLMDLKLEKEALVGAMGIEAGAIDGFHFDAVVEGPGEVGLTRRMEATCEAVAEVGSRGGLLPMGMGIGAFSLMTKLVADPITPVFLAGTGASREEEPEIAVAERALELGEAVILKYLGAQIDAGAKAVILCEPAANLVYFSPNQLAESYAVFDRFVMGPLRRVKAMLDARGVDLVLHDCGELTAGMVERFAGVDPAILSLGCSRVLWEDALLVPKTTVLYGNLPTKRFYAPELTVAEVRRLAEELLGRMEGVGHPFILGSECDVLSVPGSEREIEAKVEALLAAGRG